MALSSDQTFSKSSSLDSFHTATNADENSGPSLRSIKGDAAVRIVSLAIFINGMVGILQVLLTRFPHHPRLYGVILPFEFFRWSRTITLSLGFMLIYLSLRLLQRRRVAWWIAVAASSLAVVTHQVQFRLWYTAFAPAVTLVLLLVYRRRFTVRTEPKSITQGLILVGLCVVVAIFYGTLGFWFLDKRDFGISFSIGNSMVRTLRELSLIGNSDLVPATRHARWFIDSFHIFGIVIAGFAAYSLFRPVAYKVVALPHERHRARQIVSKSGRSSYDFFKTWPDKSYFFSDTGQSFISYKVLMGVAVCLGDPVGYENELERITASFLHYCTDNGWLVVFFLPDRISMYKRLGFSLLKIGESAVVDLKQFCENTAKKKYFRYIRRKMESEGYRLTRHKPPLDQSLLDEIEEVSNEWLDMSGHREFGFLQGNFNRDYLKGTPLSVLRDTEGQAIAFVNEIPSYRPGEATIDIMRHKPGVHWGAMDYIFQELMQSLWKEGYQYFYLGLAGIADKPGPTLIEKAIFQISTHFNWLVHSKGVRQYKEKFKPQWEDRYLVYYGTQLALAKIALAVIRIL
jgi:phosphatidylglycerol lysyltransferase